MSEAQPRGRIFLAWLDRQPTWLVYLVGLALVVAVTFGDYVTGRDISFRIFYLLPVFLVTWRCGRWPGILFSTLNGISWLLIRESDFNTTLHPAQPAWNLTIEILFFYVVVFLLDAIRRGWKHVEQLSQTDALTGAANRRHFRSVLEEVVGRARTARHALSLVYMDLDNFKAVNDRHGHTVGDAVLCHTVEGIRAELRQSDLVARLGGDEFAVILPQTDRAGAQQVVERIRERLRQGYQSARWPLSLSMGVVTFMDLPATTDEIIRTADGLMYAVKTHGKDAFRIEIWPGYNLDFTSLAPVGVDAAVETTDRGAHSVPGDLSAAPPLHAPPPPIPPPGAPPPPNLPMASMAVAPLGSAATPESPAPRGTLRLGADSGRTMRAS